MSSSRHPRGDDGWTRRVPARIRSRAALTTLLAVLGVVAGAACSQFEPAPYRPAIVAVEEPPESGRELYLRDCAWCHGNAGEGTERAPDLVTGTNGPAFTHFMLTTGRMPLEAPDEAVERRSPEYSPAQIDEIVSYVASLGGDGPDVPEPDPAAGSLQLGAVLYQENCAACHSTTLIGGALNSPAGAGGNEAVAPALVSSDAREVAEAMLVGPGAMPVFGPQTFTPEEVDSIVRYIEHQKDPDDRGGAPLGHVGPVLEGAVGWIIGLGVLLVFVRWTGTRVGE
jgi:ubiquinol-cytochrome c reductase cytochrome c subunit